MSQESHGRQGKQVSQAKQMKKTSHGRQGGVALAGQPPRLATA